MFAGLFGDLVPHPRADAPEVVSQDAYSLFYARSSAMGWLTPAVEGASGGLWGMNDAGSAPGSGAQPSRAAFFQVVLTEPDLAKLLPVQPFLACAGDVMARLGTFRLDALQVLLPERDADEDALFWSSREMRAAKSLLYASNWFGDRAPRLRAPVRVTLDGGPDPSVRAVAPSVLRWVQGLRQEVFVAGSLSLADDDHLTLRPVPFEDPASPAVHHRVTFGGTLAEWSLDALGWLAAFLGDGLSRHGVRTRFMLTADRTATERGRP